MKISTILIFLLVLGLILAGTLFLRESDPVPEQAKTEPARTVVEFRDTVKEPVYFQGDNGEFEIQFPGYCDKIVTRANEPDLFGGESWDDIIQVNHVFCDHPEIAGKGCSITSIFNLKREDGSMAGPQNVVQGVEDLMKEFGVVLESQSGIKKDFGNGALAEGVEVRARSEMGRGEVLIRGLLIYGDIYLLSAWDQQGGVWDNPEFLDFFNSFKPWAE